MNAPVLDKDFLPDATQSLEYCIRALQDNEQDGFLVYRYFTILRDLLGFTAGIFLVQRGQNARLIPAAAIGFSGATIQKMRFQAAEFSMHAETRADFGFVPTNHQLFQSRLNPVDRQKYPTVMFVKIVNQGVTEAILILSDCPYAALEPETLSVLFSGIKATLARSLQVNRAQLGNLSAPPLRSQNKTPANYGLVRTGDISKVLAQEYLGALRGSIELDVISLLARYTAAYQTHYDVKKQWFLIFYALPESDAKLYLQLLQEQITGLFAVTSKFSDLSAFFTHVSSEHG